MSVISIDGELRSPWLDVRVDATRVEASDVRSLVLRKPDGTTLPVFTAGAHLDIRLPDGCERKYSLLNDPSETDRYVIAAKRQTESRGGSAFLCDTVNAGDTLSIRLPENRFTVAEDAELSVFFAGGIGITPILSMIRHLEGLGRRWLLFYSCRSRATAPFLDELSALDRSGDRLVLRLSDTSGVARFNLPAIASAHPGGTHFYCCGPVGMLKSFEAATASLPQECVHQEYFTSDQLAAAGGFDVVLARSGRTVRIPADKTILETLLADGMNLPRSCTVGVCGTCETVVLEGIPDHRDDVLSAREKRSNRKMIICRSGCLSDRLVLDL